MPELLQKVTPVSRVSSARLAKKNKPRILPFLLVCVAFISLALIVSLKGEFALNDDYIYTWSVQHLLETGQFKIPGTVASSIFPIYVGAGACWLTGGFSYATLRAVSFIFGLFGAAGLYLALRELNLRRREAALGTAVFLLNPLFVNVCFGFMTDVPAVALNNWLLFFGIRLAKGKNSRFVEPAARATRPLEWQSVAGATATLTLAVASRQTVLAFLPALLLLAVKPRLSLPSRLLLVSVLVAWPVVLFKLLEPIVLRACDYLVSYTGYKAFVTDSLLSLVKTPVAGFTMYAEQATKVFCYLGLFCIPLTVTLFLAALFRQRAVAFKYLLPLLLLSCGALAYPLWSLMAVKSGHMPFSENLFCPPAVGTYCIISGGVPGWSDSNKNMLTYFSAGVAALLLALVSCVVSLPVGRRFFSKRAVRSGSPAKSSMVNMFVLLSALCAVGSLVLQTTVMNLDRYYLFALAPCVLVLGLLWRRFAVRGLFWLSTGMVVFMFGYSLVGSLDCMSFQRERWKALDWLISQGAPPLQIDGGPEFNYKYNMRLCEGYRMDKEYFGWPEKYRGGYPRHLWRWWPISGEKYIVCGSKLDDYRVMRTFKYFSPLKGRMREIYALEAIKSGSD